MANDFLRLSCPYCGGMLNPESELYRCADCGNRFEKKRTETDSEKIRSILDEMKAEQVANIRRRLWEETHKEYISSDAILDAAQKILDILPEDRFANFYKAAVSEGYEELNRFLDNFDVSNADDLPLILDFSVKVMEELNINSVKALAERGLTGEAKIDYYSKIEAEAEKIQSGIYNTDVPRTVFLAYSSKDMKKVNEVAAYLESQGFSCFVALRNLRHGKGAKENYQAEIMNAIANCKCVVFISSENSRAMTCDAMRIEIPFLRKTYLDKPHIEFLIEDYGKCTMPVARTMLKEYFKNQEYCTTLDDLGMRVWNAESYQPEQQKVSSVDAQAIQNMIREAMAANMQSEQKKEEDSSQEVLLKEIQSLKQQMANQNAEREKEEAERKARAEAERKAKEEAARKPKEETAPKPKEEINHPVQGKTDAAVEAYQTTVKELESKIRSKETALSNAGLFEIGKKKDLKAEIQQLHTKLSTEKAAKGYLIPLKKQTEVCDRIYFGNYHGIITWRKLATRGRQILVISEKALDCQPYNTRSANVTWETCTLRSWLNSTFLNAAFSKEEQTKILWSTVSADPNPQFNSNPGNATKDRIFLLSIAEVRRYFSSNESRKCVPTALARNLGGSVDNFSKKDGEATCWWWLRTTGAMQNIATGVAYGYDINYGETGDVSHSNCVRPAMWIDPEA